MFVLFLVAALIGGAVLLALNAHERVEGLVLVDKATGDVVFGGWAILAEQAVIAGILATVVFLVALAIGFGASDLHIRLALRRRLEWLDRTYSDRQVSIARDDRLRFERQLAATERRLVAVKGQRAEFRRSLRNATRERDSMRRAINAERTRADGAALALHNLLHKSGKGDAPPAEPHQPKPKARHRAPKPPPSGLRRSMRNTSR
ncbi:MAG: hypothetical protein OXK82_11945 [Deltaproteobacteria bacterium]|nr:hypothetical protein [Deltaproteobacteria bacterium]